MRRPRTPTADAVDAVPTGRPCPVCGRPALQAFVPFCSKRCADIDLNRWLGGVYAVPGEPEDTAEGEEPAADR